MYPTQDQVYGSCAILLVASTCAVVARFYVRTSMGRAGLKWDDWTLLIGLILTWLMGISLFVGASMGAVGTHTRQDPVTGQLILTQAEINESKLSYAFNFFLIPAITFIKLSILLLYRRIFTTRMFQRISLLFCCITGMWGIAFLVADSLQCGLHPEAIWTSVKAVHLNCHFRQGVLQICYASTDVAADVLILLLPVYMVGKLQMSLKTKITVIGIFMLGVLATIAGIARLVIIYHFDFKQDPKFNDLIGVTSLIYLASQVEASIGVVAACLPTLRPLVTGDKYTDSFIQRFLSRISSRRGSSSDGSLWQPNKLSQQNSNDTSRGYPNKDIKVEQSWAVRNNNSISTQNEDAPHTFLGSSSTRNTDDLV